MPQEKEEIYFSSPVNLAEDGELKGKFEGVAYSGKPIKRHGFFQNLVIDLDTASFKSKVPIYKNHDDEKIVGNAKLQKADGKLMIKDGVLFESSTYAQEIKALSKDGLDWELSVGLRSDYDLEMLMEKQSATVNGVKIKGPATILRQANVKEVSFTPVGADKNTNVNVFKDQGEYKMPQPKENKELEKSIELSQEEFDSIALACSCQKGATASDVAKKAGEMKSDSEKLKNENSKLKTQVEDLKKELSELKKKDKKEEIKKAAEGKMDMSDEKIEELLADEVKFNATMEVLEQITPQKKIKKEFAEVGDFSEEESDESTNFTADENKVNKIELACKKLMEEKDIDRDSAYALLPDSMFE